MAVLRARDVESFQPEATRHVALWESTVNSLRVSILRGELPRGAQLVEVDLAARLGVSRGPVREALRRLELEGLAENQPRKGAFVVGMSEQDVHEIYSLRVVLETFAIERAASLGTLDDLVELRDHVAHMRIGVRLGLPHQIARHDVAFHRKLLLMARHKRLLVVWEPVAIPVHTLLSVADTVHTNMPTSVEQHLLLVDAVERHAGKEAVALVRDHLVQGEQIVLNVVRSAVTGRADPSPVL